MKARTVTAASEYAVQARVGEVVKHITTKLNKTVQSVKYQTYTKDGKAMIRAIIYYK